jgi:glutathione synthase/RimK-type ligase-like ATP-grasp enzyme
MKTYGSLCVSKPLLDKHGIPEQETIIVKVGTHQLPARLTVQNSTQCRFMLSPALARALLIRKRGRLQLRYDKAGNYIHIGPTIGILATSLAYKLQYDPTSIRAELIYLSHVSRSLNAQIYVFTPDSINWNENTARGYVYQKGSWIGAVYPLPDVVYDRITSRSSEEKFSHTRNKLMEITGNKYFNPSFLNKWKVYQLLSEDQILKKYLPETKSLTTENMQDMMGKYKTLFVKPSNGSLGKGIIKVNILSKGKMSYVVYGNSRYKSQADNVEEFLKKTTKVRKDKPYIVQQGLDLAVYRGSLFDLRVIFQKNRDGKWLVAKKFVRLAPRGSSISNLSRGGKVEISKRIFRYIYHNKDRVNRKFEEAKQLCLRVATVLEEKSNGVYGELGMDIGIDKNGALWLIEVNSKPRKTTDSEFSRAIMRRTFKRPLEYAMFLAGFKTK